MSNLAESAVRLYVGDGKNPAPLPPWMVAGARAIFGALITGAVVALSTWNVTDTPKEIIIPSVSAALTYMGARLGIEGYVDQRRNGRKGNGE